MARWGCRNFPGPDSYPGQTGPLRDCALVDGSNIDDALKRKGEAGGEALLPVFGVGGKAELLQVEVLVGEIFLGVTVAEEIRGFAQRSRK